MTAADLTVPPGRAILDTNVLLAATDEARAEHRAALKILNSWPELYVSGQILREYLSVATRPVDKNGLGLKTADAIGNVRAVLERATLLADDSRVAHRLLNLLHDIDCCGKQVHDANIIATMLVHGIDTVVSMNTADFARFASHVSLVKL
jgi:predicted nucleic acid-binding protein